MGENVRATEWGRGWVPPGSGGLQTMELGPVVRQQVGLRHRGCQPCGCRVEWGAQPVGLGWEYWAQSVELCRVGVQG